MDDTGLTVSAPASATMALEAFPEMSRMPQLGSAADQQSSLRILTVRRNVARLD